MIIFKYNKYFIQTKYTILYEKCYFLLLGFAKKIVDLVKSETYQLINYKILVVSKFFLSSKCTLSTHHVPLAYTHP